MRSAAELRSLFKDDYHRRSLTPLFIRSPQRSKSICSASSHLVKLPLRDEEEKRTKTARRREYDQMLRRRSKPRLSTPTPPRVFTPVRCPTPRKLSAVSSAAVATSMQRYLARKRAVERIQFAVRRWLKRRKDTAARKILGCLRRWRRQRQRRKLAKWLFLVCLYVRVVSLRLLKPSAPCIQVTPQVAEVPVRSSPHLTKRKTLVEDFKHFVLSSKIEQAVMAFRWNLEVSRRNRQVTQGLKDFQHVAARLLQRCLRPALQQLKSHYEECRRARLYRPSKQRQSQRFLIRDRKTIQSLSHKLALVLGTRSKTTTAGAPKTSGLLVQLKRFVTSLIPN